MWEARGKGWGGGHLPCGRQGERSGEGRPGQAAPTAKQHYTNNAFASTTQLFMGWGPDPIWSTGHVESNIQACPSGSCVSLRVTVDDGSDFLYPGQYVQVKPAGGAYL